MYRLLDLFSGIGGFSLGLERSGGFKTVAFCEIDPYCRKVLAKHWPSVPCYDDIRLLTAEQLVADGIGVDAICGGFPCQDISLAGKGEGIEAARSGLWFEYARLISELRPAIVAVENVSELLGRGLDAVLGSLAALRYDAEWHCLPAGAIGAPHIRDRVWIIAYPHGSRLSRQSPIVCAGALGSKGEWWDDISELVSDDFRASVAGCPPQAQPFIRRGDDGFSHWAHRLRALGNAVVPQIPELIGRAIIAAESA